MIDEIQYPPRFPKSKRDYIEAWRTAVNKAENVEMQPDTYKSLLDLMLYRMKDDLNKQMQLLDAGLRKRVNAILAIRRDRHPITFEPLDDE